MFLMPFGAGPAHVVLLGMIRAEDHASHNAAQLHRQSTQPAYKICDGYKWTGSESRHSTIRISLPHNVPLTAYKFEMGGSPLF
jgi:hypothetical protein